MSNTVLLEPAPRTRLSQKEKLEYARRQIALPVAIFLGVTVLYLGIEFVTLAVPSPFGFLLAPLCGVVIGMLFIVGHDACHNSLTASFWLNQVIGRLAFMPSLHSFSLWDLGHNQMHHGYNNVRGSDRIWEPMSPEDYRTAGATRRAMYRFYHSPAGVPFYYMIELWARYASWSIPDVYRDVKPVYAFDTPLVLLFIATQVWAVITVGAIFGHGVVLSLLVGFIIPFLVWNGFMSLIIFLHHTHPMVRWYRSIPAWRAARGVIGGAAHVQFVWPFKTILLSIMEHNAHHAAPGVPLYNLPRMQKAMEANEDILVWPFTWRGFARVCRRCKLYDYDLDRWVTFEEAESNGNGAREHLAG